MGILPIGNGGNMGIEREIWQLGLETLAKPVKLIDSGI